jgi:sarcosine oxidase subunit alpha
VTGPLASELLQLAGLTHRPAFLEHKFAEVAGVTCRVCRLSFTGEASYELHHNVSESQALWTRLMHLGGPLGIRPHGLEALFALRLEKGHIILGQDTDLDSTPRRLRHEWAVKLEKPQFIGKGALLRTNKVPLDRQLVGLESDEAAPPEGAIIWHDAKYAGYVTSSFWSPVLGKAVMLGWLKLFNGELPAEVRIGNILARRTATPFYDPQGKRAQA